MSAAYAETRLPRKARRPAAGLKLPLRQRMQG